MNFNCKNSKVDGQEKRKWKKKNGGINFKTNKQSFDHFFNQDTVFWITQHPEKEDLCPQIVPVYAVAYFQG